MRPLPDAGQAWLHRHPLALDAALAAGVLACMVAGSFPDSRGEDRHLWATHTPSMLGVVLMVLAAATLFVRRSAPRTVLAVTGTLSLVELVFDQPRAPVAMSAVVALYTVATTTDRPTTWRVSLLTGSVLTTAGMVAGPWPWYTQENIGIFAWTGLAAAAGDAVRSRRAFVQAMRERAERAERTREEEARRRVAEERLRIARDLHDVVAHHIALVNVQAGVAAHVMDRRPDQAKEALEHVRQAGRTALGELRATVGLLRQSGDPQAPTEPAPGLDRLDDLVETYRHAGLPVEVSHAAPGPGLPAAVDLAAYRIIQEALTNVRKHAGAGASAEVFVVRTRRRLELTVLDTGPSATACRVGTADPADPARSAGFPDPADPGGPAEPTGPAEPAATSGPVAPATAKGPAPTEEGDLPDHENTDAYATSRAHGAQEGLQRPEDAAGRTGRTVPDGPDGSDGTAALGAPPSPAGPGAPQAVTSAVEGPEKSEVSGKPEEPEEPGKPEEPEEFAEFAESGRHEGGRAGLEEHDGPDEHDRHGGLGLVGMRERAAALGGSCSAGPRSEGGFRVHVILPFGHVDRAQGATGGRA